ncbi:MAG: YkgJ family cysteine cluster protein [Candidatus Thorarchaeota archaeon]|nr:YkgJ family cysteine cluster protein [Candidatus Thorarchaeota archaeon]
MCVLLSAETKFECTMCGACCRDDTLLVTLTGTDISRIAFFLDLSASSILRALDFYVIDSKKNIPKGLRHIPRVNTENGPAFVAVRKMENGDCVFLEDNLCMIHSIRPSVCMSFPFVFRKDSGETKWGLSARNEICPGLGKGKQVDAKELEALGSDVLADIEYFTHFAAVWNRETKEPTALDFIERVLETPEFSLSKDF